MFTNYVKQLPDISFFHGDRNVSFSSEQCTCNSLSHVLIPDLFLIFSVQNLVEPERKRVLWIVLEALTDSVIQITGRAQWPIVTTDPVQSGKLENGKR